MARGPRVGTAGRAPRPQALAAQGNVSTYSCQPA